MFSFNPLPCSPPHSTGCPAHQNLGRTDISAHHSVFHATYRRGSNYAAPCRGGRGQGQLSSHGARSRRPKDNSDQLKSRLCGETRGETGRGERRETLAGKLLITPAACLPACPSTPPARSGLLSQSGLAATAHSISMLPPYWPAGILPDTGILAAAAAAGEFPSAAIIFGGNQQ